MYLFIVPMKTIHKLRANNSWNASIINKARSKQDILMGYDWDGIKTRRMRRLKYGLSLFLFTMSISAPTAFLLHLR